MITCATTLIHVGLTQQGLQNTMHYNATCMLNNKAYNNLGKSTCLWLSLQLGPKLWGVGYNRSCTPYITYASLIQVQQASKNVLQRLPIICPIYNPITTLRSFSSHYHHFCFASSSRLCLLCLLL
jgi:hypothetical protein